jgi:hypothetical protein
MKQFACLAVLLSLVACEPTSPENPASAPSEKTPKNPAALAGAALSLPSGYTLSGPKTHANLCLFLIHKPGVAKDSVNYLTLEEALQAKALSLTEKSDGAQVNKIEVENAGENPVFLQAGDTVKGGQQDRTIAVDLILPPKSGKRDLDAYCVEPGRWSARATAGVSMELHRAAFGAAAAPVATKEQKLAVKLEHSQGKVWEEGRKTNAQLAKNAEPTGGTGVPPSAPDSFVLAAEEPAVQKKTAEYTEALGLALEGQDDVVGVAFAVNGEPSTVEIYSGPGLFKKLWPKLLKGAALEALSKKTDATPTKAVTAEAIQALMAEAQQGKTSTKDLTGDMAMETVDGSRSARFETKVKGEVFHCQVIKK